MCVCYSRTRTRAHSPPKAILLQGTIRSTFLRSGEWHSILNRHNITKKLQGENKFAFSEKNMSETPGGQQDSVPVLMT